MATVVTAIATVVLTIATLLYVGLTYRLLRAQTEPCIIVYAQNQPCLDLRLLIEIVVENVGNGIARDIRFSFSERIPCRLLSRDGGEWMDEGPLIDGIPALGPKQKRIVGWGTYDELKERLGTRQIRVTVSHRGPSDDERVEVEQVLEVASLAHHQLRFDDPGWTVAEELRQIRSLLEHRNP